MMTMSYRRWRSANSTLMALDCSSSAGLGGMAPLVITSRPDFPQRWRTYATCTRPIRTVVRPTTDSRFRYSAIFGRRRSLSSRRVRLPAWARVMAILMAVVDFTVAGHRTRDGEDLGFFVGVKALQVGAQDAERFDPRGMLVHFGDQRMLDRSWHHHTTTVEMVRPGRLSPRRQAGRAISRLSPPADPVSSGGQVRRIPVTTRNREPKGMGRR